ncbi:formyltetrahydrofolate-dependent phosphoribosylglycinamide formyltransferase [Clostridium amylolyticum]|uniref:Phosphoribosylglycinamide formyltransferase n=1 Tax=Clostridium amylolyticum TaxID=1121298 RepID=A0A1M6IN75_9CLOT|nr:phosphoribosylglycinamide formyltransferase [Clostridium amylolyticum]SHJ35860.1 formyltetrahydrofolate-dependent phosphoribosylglycinamide formyltransferase [Clostridium amylolyticum]
MLKIAVFVSGGGSNLQAIMDSINKGELNCSIVGVISDNADAKALKRAEEKGITTYVLDRGSYRENIGDKALEILGDRADLIVLAGFLSILKGEILKVYKDKIINIHPSLIPNFCGKGMYGKKVHEAVINSGVKTTGCTVHFVNEEVDGGAVLLQKTVSVESYDNADTLQKKVLTEEHKILIEAINLIEKKKISLTSQGVKILEEVV